MRMGRHRGRPIYGRVVHKAPLLRIQDLAERNRAFEEVAKMYGTVQRQTEPRRRITAFRLSGGGHLPSLGLTPQSGSFQHLKVSIPSLVHSPLNPSQVLNDTDAQLIPLQLVKVPFRGSLFLPKRRLTEYLQRPHTQLYQKFYKIQHSISSHHSNIFKSKTWLQFFCGEYTYCPYFLFALYRCLFFVIVLLCESVEPDSMKNTIYQLRGRRTFTTIYPKKRFKNKMEI